MRRYLYPLLAGPVLSACVIVPPPVVSAFNGDSVSIDTVTALAPFPSGLTQAEAQRICDTVDKRAEYASTRVVEDVTSRHLYLCL